MSKAVLQEQVEQVQHVRGVGLPGEGLQAVMVPKDGRIVAIALGRDEWPMVVVVAAPDAPTTEREFYVTRSYLPIGSAERIKIGQYLGHSQVRGEVPFHVFEASSY